MKASTDAILGDISYCKYRQFGISDADTFMMKLGRCQNFHDKVSAEGDTLQIYTNMIRSLPVMKYPAVTYQFRRCGTGKN